MGAISVLIELASSSRNMTRTMKYHATLLLRGLGLNEPHVSPGDGFADRFGIGSVVLLPLDVGLNVGRWYRPYHMAERLELARPMVR